MLKSIANYAGVVFLKLLSLLPYKLLVSIGYGLGFIAARLSGDRNRVVKTNLQLCFPNLNENEINRLSKKHWRLLGRSLVEKSIIWLGSEKQLSQMIEVKSAVDLTNRKPRILVNMHFTGIEGSIILSALAKKMGWPRTSGFFQRMKNPFFNRKIIEWRNRFGGNSIDRQGNAKAIIREIKNGDFIIIAPDIDLGLKDSEFVPFFGIETNTITTISRLASITGADVCMMLTTLKDDGSGYVCEISKPLDNFPGNNAKSDTARLNALFEKEIRLRPAEYYWVHKRFKNRPNHEANPYNPSI
ncbi:lipid A biosynthesis acyltransferase [Polynucleobacter wuianus]|uniref:Lipid A biosynthesis acyltransferase n=1 Tax=Polynucleobacter wuianus TaxID=1743168 RepID=A0A191UI75_9BURK|nr:lipid A biosynthesis acyltransferase [Polynucleobacter wuianus]ANJ00602.1 lipid A biosynthesis acyltransferase [Polynucleobacter wuianus]MBU3553204.1 lipid A biosynthesis acyltransferase [Polynucleobacter sp. MWH-Post4-6-1]MBU3609881.1 lipid A biosynthesis acyltransferase [Polynucleobacter wuianus]